MSCGCLPSGGTGAVTCVAMSNEQSPVRAAEVRAGRWELTGAVGLALINDYLGYVADRGYSARTVRAYAFDLLHFARWLAGEGIVVAGVDTDVLLRYLAANRSERRDDQPANVIPLGRGTASGFAPATINRRLAAISGLFAFRSMRDPDAVNPVPKGPAARRTARGERTGLLAHLASPKPRSKLRVREPRRLPRGLDRAETATLMGSFRADRDRAIAGLMLLSGLRSAEVLGLRVADVDIARGWVRVTGKGDKERRVPLDPDVAGLIQSYLLAERPETVVEGAVRRGEGPASRAAADRGRAAPGVPLPPGDLRGGGRAPARAAAHIRHGPGGGRGGSGGAAGADGPRPRRVLGGLHSSRARARACRLRRGAAAAAGRAAEGLADAASQDGRAGAGRSDL